MTTRAARRAQIRNLERGKVDPRALRRARTRPDERPSIWRVLGFSAVVVAVMAVGLYFATNVLFRSGPAGMDMSGGTTVVAPESGAAIPLGVSMDGFDPKVVKAKPGQRLTFDWWNTDQAMHLDRGVHTMVSDTLGIRYELPAQSQKTISLVAPTKPGEYDYWCDSCCGGKDNPGMHAKIVVEA